MKIVGKLTKVSLASSLIASSILGVSQATYAKAQSKQNQAQDKVAMYGNTKKS